MNERRAHAWARRLEYVGDGNTGVLEQGVGGDRGAYNL